MQRFIGLLFYLVLSGSVPASSQSAGSTEIFFLTCFPGNEVASVYGHSALRVVDASVGSDEVYNWGVYDFSTPNFTWKFAKGRLKYKIASCPYEQFLQEYVNEQRRVVSQKINLTANQKEVLITLINNNMQPENELYLYNFFYDNCSTRIRDIIEKATGDRLVYPGENTKIQPSFRKMINKAQKPMPWLIFGTDMLIGIPGDKKTGFREQMFLPEELMKNLSVTMIKDNNLMIPILQKPVTVVESSFSEPNTNFFLTPVFIFSLLFVIIALLSVFTKTGKIIDGIDKLLFLAFSVLSVMMIFFTFFTDHQAMKMNLNIIWLNPILVIAFVALFLKSRPTIWFKIIFVISAAFLLFLILLPQSFNLAIIPLILVLIIRSAARSELSFTSFLKQNK